MEWYIELCAGMVKFPSFVRTYSQAFSAVKVDWIHKTASKSALHFGADIHGARRETNTILVF